MRIVRFLRASMAFVAGMLEAAFSPWKWLFLLFSCGLEETADLDPMAD